MWFLYAIQNDQKQAKALLRPNQTYTLGRRDADILPPVIDKSISRRHATIKVEPMTKENWKQADWMPSVWCNDLGSKFGSFVNSNKLEGQQLEQGVKLKDGDFIRIGTKAATFQLAWEPLIVCRQALTQVEKQKLYSAALQIGAKITQSVRSPYTHLLMSNIRISFKLARCLADGKPIISQSWLDVLVDQPDTDFKFPPVSDYAPPIDASCNGPQGTPDFTPNPRRAQLFAGKRFIFFEEDQYQQLSQMVDACSGHALLLNLNKTDPFDEQLGDDNTIVIECGNLQDTTAGKNVIHVLDSFERRTISSMEICWAILYCSTDIQCNTDIIKAASNLLSFTSNARMNHTLEAGPHNRPTSDLPAMSAQASISSTVDRSLLSPSSPPIQNHQPPNQHQHDQGRTTSVGSPPERSEEKDLDLDDIFDQLVGDDEPSRPAPTLQSLRSQPSSSRPTTSSDNGSSSRAQHQKHSEAFPTTPPPNQQKRSAEKDDDDVFGSAITTTPRRRARDSEDSFLQEELSPGPSTKRQRKDEHQDANPKPDKGKKRMYDPPILNVDNQPEPTVNDGAEEPSPNPKPRKRQKAIRKEVDISMTNDYTPYALPELENENVDLVPGKSYTKVGYVKLVVAPNPPVPRLLPQSSHQINYKIFKKAVHPLPCNPLSVVTMATEVPLDVRGSREHSPVSDDNDYSEIRIRSNAPRRAAMRF